MSAIFQPTHCPQCACDSAHVAYDNRTGGYRITCGRCGRFERHELEFDDEGGYSGFSHEVRKGFGVLFFRYTGDHQFYSHSLNTPREVIDAESWLRERLRNGGVDPETASLTKWDDEARRIEVVLGERIDLLAGRIVRTSGLPGDVRQDNREATASPRMTRGTSNA